MLCEILKPHATKWREIGQHLDFLPGDLDNIQAAPLLLQTAPISSMNAVLEKFLQEREGGAMVSVLETALTKAGLGVTASQLRNNVQRLLAQGIVVTIASHDLSDRGTLSIDSQILALSTETLDTIPSSCEMSLPTPMSFSAVLVSTPCAVAEMEKVFAEVVFKLKSPLHKMFPWKGYNLFPATCQRI